MEGAGVCDDEGEGVVEEVGEVDGLVEVPGEADCPGVGEEVGEAEGFGDVGLVATNATILTAATAMMMIAIMAISFF